MQYKSIKNNINKQIEYNNMNQEQQIIPTQQIIKEQQIEGQQIIPTQQIEEKQQIIEEQQIIPEQQIDLFNSPKLNDYNKSISNTNYNTYNSYNLGNYETW